MTTYKEGEVFKDVPVIKFIDYEGVVVLLNDRLEHACITTKSNLYDDGIPIYHITAPQGTKADLVVKKKTHFYDIEPLYLEVTKIRIGD